MTMLLDIQARHAQVARLIDDALLNVEARFRAQLQTPISPVARLCEGVERYRGKMLRPTMVIACGLAADQSALSPGAITADHLTVAAVIEMIHLATLVHDDVLDDAETRRGGGSINHQHGNETAVILGDYLISNAYHLCSTLDSQQTALRIARITNTVCEGEILQIHHRGDFALDERTYFQIIERKTAALIGVACELGARYARAGEPIVQRFLQFGTRLGSAFQIQDDLLDLVGDEQVVGKSLGKDLANGKLTLPMIHHLARLSATRRAASIDSFTSDGCEPPDRRLIIEALQQTGSIAYARNYAARLIHEAKVLLEPIADNPARAYLASLADAVVTREF